MYLTGQASDTKHDVGHNSERALAGAAARDAARGGPLRVPRRQRARGREQRGRAAAGPV